MAVEIIWTNKAEKSFENIVKYLKNSWSEKSAINFVRTTNSILDLISKNPLSFQKAEKENVRRSVITKQTSVYYEINENSVHLLIFWDNRQNPMKLVKD